MKQVLCYCGGDSNSSKGCITSTKAKGSLCIFWEESSFSKHCLIEIKYKKKVWHTRINN